MAERSRAKRNRGAEGDGTGKPSLGVVAYPSAVTPSSALIIVTCHACSESDTVPADRVGMWKTVHQALRHYGRPWDFSQKAAR
jgi:hypothetical protein